MSTYLIDILGFMVAKLGCICRIARATRLGYSLPSLDPADRATDIDGTARYKVEQGGVAAQANWSVGGARLTSITSWRFWNWKPQNDADQTGLSLFARAQTTTLQRQFSQELRVASEGRAADLWRHFAGELSMSAHQIVSQSRRRGDLGQSRYAALCDS